MQYMWLFVQYHDSSTGHMGVSLHFFNSDVRLQKRLESIVPEDEWQWLEQKYGLKLGTRSKPWWHLVWTNLGCTSPTSRIRPAIDSLIKYKYLLLPSYKSIIFMSSLPLFSLRCIRLRLLLAEQQPIPAYKKLKSDALQLDIVHTTGPLSSDTIMVTILLQKSTERSMLNGPGILIYILPTLWSNLTSATNVFKSKILQQVFVF